MTNRLILPSKERKGLIFSDHFKFCHFSMSQIYGVCAFIWGAPICVGKGDVFSIMFLMFLNCIFSRYKFLILDLLFLFIMILARILKDIMSFKMKARHDGYSDQFNRIFMTKLLLVCSIVMSVEYFSDQV